MEQSYCGKQCSACDRMSEGRCAGCLEGPGKTLSSTCSIASCARSKGHESCGQCNFRNNCGKYADRHSMIRLREENAKSQEQRIHQIHQRSGVLAKWLWLLFWTLIPSVAGSFLSLLGLKSLGQIVQFGTNIVYGLILLRIGVEFELYRQAGIFYIVTAGIQAVFVLWSNGPLNSVLDILHSIFGIIGIYYLTHAHSIAMEPIDRDLSEKWLSLWRWYLWTLVGTPVVTLLAVLFMFSRILEVLSFVLILAMGIGALAISVMDLIFLFKSAKAAEGAYNRLQQSQQ